MEALKFDNVRFSYTESKQDNAQDVFAEDAFFAVDGVNLSVEEGEFVAVLGHNGSGKSNLARLTNGLLSATEGTVVSLGMDVSNAKNLFETVMEISYIRKTDSFADMLYGRFCPH